MFGACRLVAQVAGLDHAKRAVQYVADDSIFADAVAPVCAEIQAGETCHRCGIKRKKTLAEREHRCSCGASCSRDENAARVMLNWALHGKATGRESVRGGVVVV